MKSAKYNIDFSQALEIYEEELGYPPKRQYALTDEDAVFKESYDQCSPEHQAIIDAVIDELVGKREHEGFNLKLILNAYKLDGAKPMELAKHLRYAGNNPFMYNFGASDLLKQISSNMNTVQLFGKHGGSEPIIQEICEDYLISTDLITKGQGEMYHIKEDVLKQYLADKEFQEKEIWNKRYIEETYQREPIAAGTVKSIMEQYAKHIGKSWDEIIDVNYAYLKYNGKYQALKQSKNKNAVNAVNRLAILLRFEDCFPNS